MAYREEEKTHLINSMTQRMPKLSLESVRRLDGFLDRLEHPAKLKAAAPDICPNCGGRRTTSACGLCGLC